MQPYEIVCSPYTVYLAPSGTAFPAITASPSTAWTQIGTSGSKNYTDVGVTVTHSQTLGEFIPVGGTVPRKAWRQQEGLAISFEVADISPAQYALLLNGITVVTVGSPGADQHFEVYRGVTVAAFAMLVRGISPVNEAYTAQYEVTACYNVGNPAPKYSKAGPATLLCEFHAYEQLANVLTTWRAQTNT